MKFCALTNNGNAQIGLVENNQSLSFYKELDLHDTCKSLILKFEIPFKFLFKI